MGVFDLFKRKKEEMPSDLGLPSEGDLKPELGLREDMGLPGAEERPAPSMPPAREAAFGASEMPTFPAPSAPRQAVSVGNRDVELISAKLDTINAKLDNLNARVANLEKIAAGEEKASEEITW